MTVAEKKMKIVELMRRIFKNAGNENDFEAHLNKLDAEEEKLNYCANQAQSLQQNISELTSRLKLQYKTSITEKLRGISSSELIRARSQRDIDMENKRLLLEGLKLCKEIGLLGLNRKAKKYEQWLKEKAVI